MNRKTVDQITDDELDALYDQIAERDRLLVTAERMRQGKNDEIDKYADRLEQAEAERDFLAGVIGSITGQPPEDVVAEARTGLSASPAPAQRPSAATGSTTRTEAS